MSMDTSERWARNQEIAAAVGWTNIKEWTTYSVGSIGAIGVHFEGTTPEGVDAVKLPDFYGSLDAVADALPENTHITIEPRPVQRRMTYLVTLVNPDAEPIAFSYGDGATRQEAAGNALLAYARAHKEPTP